MALELSVVGLAGVVALGVPAPVLMNHRGRESLRSVRVEGGDRRRLQGDVPDPLPLAVDEVHLRGVVPAVPDDGRDGLPVDTGIPDAPEGVVPDYAYVGAPGGL